MLNYKIRLQMEERKCLDVTKPTWPCLSVPEALSGAIEAGMEGDVACSDLSCVTLCPNFFTDCTSHQLALVAVSSLTVPVRVYPMRASGLAIIPISPITVRTAQLLLCFRIVDHPAHQHQTEKLPVA